MCNELIGIIKDIFSPKIEVTEHTAFKTDLEFDSFEIITMIDVLEEKYNIIINEMDMPSLVTVGDLCEYIENLI